MALLYSFAFFTSLLNPTLPNTIVIKTLTCHKSTYLDVHVNPGRLFKRGDDISFDDICAQIQYLEHADSPKIRGRYELSN